MNTQRRKKLSRQATIIVADKPADLAALGQIDFNMFVSKGY
jgi:hypothetical protein